MQKEISCTDFIENVQLPLQMNDSFSWSCFDRTVRFNLISIYSFCVRIKKRNQSKRQLFSTIKATSILWILVTQTTYLKVLQCIIQCMCIYRVCLMLSSVYRLMQDSFDFSIVVFVHFGFRNRISFHPISQKFFAF